MKQAVILAAGEGERLRPFTVTKPKAMLSIAAKPILQYVVEALAQNGIRNIVMVVGYRREQIFDYVGNGEQFGVDVIYIMQEKQLGTAHALAQAEDAVENEFLVLPGDHLIEADTIARFVATTPNTVLVKKVDNPTRHGVVTVDKGMVKGIVEKPEEAKGNIVNTGIYAFSREIFDFVESELGIPDVLNKMLAHALIALVPIAFVLFGVRDFIGIISFLGAVMGGFEGIAMILTYFKAKKMGNRMPEYSLKIPHFIYYFFNIHGFLLFS